MTRVMIIDMEQVRKRGGINRIMGSRYVREMGLICLHCRRSLGRYFVRRQGGTHTWYYCLSCAAILFGVNRVNEKEAKGG